MDPTATAEKSLHAQAGVESLFLIRVFMNI
jgi:hypothetical protein